MVLLFIRSHFKPELVLTEDHDRLGDVEVNLHGVKTIVFGVYAPNENKVVFYQRLMENSVDLPYKSWCSMGDWNTAISQQRDRTSEKNIQILQYKIPNIFFDMIDILRLADLEMAVQENMYIFQKDKAPLPPHE